MANLTIICFTFHINTHSQHRTEREGESSECDTANLTSQNTCRLYLTHKTLWFHSHMDYIRINYTLKIDFFTNFISYLLKTQATGLQTRLHEITTQTTTNISTTYSQLEAKARVSGSLQSRPQFH
jgi:hypothetical protein